MQLAVLKIIQQNKGKKVNSDFIAEELKVDKKRVQQALRRVRGYFGIKYWFENKERRYWYLIQ